jgi:hypothetical protein
VRPQRRSAGALRGDLPQDRGRARVEAPHGLTVADYQATFDRGAGLPAGTGQRLQRRQPGPLRRDLGQVGRPERRDPVPCARDRGLAGSRALFADIDHPDDPELVGQCQRRVEVSMAREVSAAQVGEHKPCPSRSFPTMTMPDLVCDRVAAKIMCRCLGCCFLTGRERPVSGGSAA